MPSRLPPHFIDLVYDALLKSFWTKKALKNFLRRSHVAESFLSQLDHSESKREWLDRLFPKLEDTDRGQSLIQQMARSLSEQSRFPDLDNWEDSAEKIAAASTSVTALKAYLNDKDQQKRDEREAAQRRQAGEEQRLKNIGSQADLSSLKERLDTLCIRIGTQQGGYDFQDWFYDLMDYSEVDYSGPRFSDHGRAVLR